jgi:hypothetical protein
MSAAAPSGVAEAGLVVSSAADRLAAVKAAMRVRLVIWLLLP